MAKLLHDVIECYTKPAFITYCVHSAYTVCLLPWVAIEKLSGRNLGDFHLLRKPVIVSAALLSVVSAAAAYFWYLSLPRTYVWANNTIYQSNPVWVYLFSIAFLGSSWDWRKVVPLVLCFSGIVIISLSSKDGGSGGATPQPTPSPSGGRHECIVTHTSDFGGYIYVLFSVLGFALFEVFYKKYGCDQSKKETSALRSISGSCFYLGLIGVFTAVLLALIIVLLDVTGAETFVVPSKSGQSSSF